MSKSLEVHEAGGGIHSTVAKTRAASEGELLAALLPRLRRMLEHGTTLAEAKSGYGLDAETEAKMLLAAEARGQWTRPSPRIWPLRRLYLVYNDVRVYSTL